MTPHDHVAQPEPPSSAAGAEIFRRWEEAIRRFRNQPGNERAVRENYFDQPPRLAAERFLDSEEFAAVEQLMPREPGRLLDYGAGVGIASYAFARRGWQVTALEPNPSLEVGAGAIEQLAREAGLVIRVSTHAELPLPLQAGAFDVVYCREALHHLPDLGRGVAEMSRLLVAGGLLVATREPVVDDDEQLQQFLSAHLLHAQTGAENAHPLAHYREAFRRAGFSERCLLGHLESVVNYYPGSEADRRRALEAVMATCMKGAGRFLAKLPAFEGLLTRWIVMRDRTPGRNFTFVLQKR